MKNTHPCFTLLELLVVMAILTILAALLLPAMNSSMKKSDHLLCISNLRQLHGAAALYLSDHNNRLFGYSPKGTVYQHPGTNWTYFLYEYYHDLALLDCPVSEDPAPKNDSPQAMHYYDGNYGFNYDGCVGNNGPLYSHIDSPSRGYLFFDSGDPCLIYDANHWKNMMEELDLDWDSGSEGCNRHDDKVGIVFVDGHYEARSLLDFISAPCQSGDAPWYMDWQGGSLVPGEIRFPKR